MMAWLETGGFVMADLIIIDTICVLEPVTMALLALGGLALR